MWCLNAVLNSHSSKKSGFCRLSGKIPHSSAEVCRRTKSDLARNFQPKREETGKSQNWDLWELPGIFTVEISCVLKIQCLFSHYRILWSLRPMSHHASRSKLDRDEFIVWCLVFRFSSVGAILHWKPSHHIFQLDADIMKIRLSTDYQ